MKSVLLETTLATFLLEIEKSCVTFDSWTPVISESYYFPFPQWKGASELDAKQARLCTSTSRSEPNPGGSSLAAQHTFAPLFSFLKFDFKQLSSAFLKVSTALKSLQDMKLCLDGFNHF